MDSSNPVRLWVGHNGVVGADRDSGEYRGDQAGTGYFVAGFVELGDGDYYWRIDEA